MERVRRQTRQRQAVLEALCRHGAHPTAGQVYQAVRRQLPRISLGTVYRNLELFVGQGLAVKIQAEGAEARFDGNRRPHGHVRCIRCGRVQDVPKSQLPLRPGEVRRVAGFRILEVHLDLRGLCPSCAAAVRASPAGGWRFPAGRRRPAHPG